MIVTLSYLLLACNHTKQKDNRSIDSKKLPNIVLLIGDDQGYPYFGFMGADYVHTPNMDTLAVNSTVFTNGYVPANHCRPSLQSLMTGTLPIDYNAEVLDLLHAELKTKQNLSNKERALFEKNFQHHAMQYFTTLPKLLAKQGYSSFQGGKWWEYHYKNGGFTHGMTTGWTAEERKQKGWFKKFMGGTGLQLGRVTNQAAYDFIEENDKQPFFLWFAPELPHYPFDASERYYDLYKNAAMTESAKRYYANCTWFDDNVGKLMNYLKTKGKFDNTLFIYVNDNGWEQNPDQEFRHDSLRWHNGGDKGKLSMYDQSFRTPIIFSWKGKIKKGVVNDDLMHSTDIPATILDYIELPIPENYFGKSYKAAIEGKPFSARQQIIGKVNQIRSEDNMMGKKLEGYWLRNENWFFNWSMETGAKTLYNMNTDPLNNHNLVHDFPDQVEAFSKEIVKWKQLRGR